jgi:hypothetical protein
MPLSDIPPPFVVKANNRSRAILLVRSAPDLDAHRIRNTCREWLGRSAYGAPFREWGYTETSTAVMIEAFLSVAEQPAPPPDYKIDVFSGKARQIFYCDRAGNVRAMFAPDWEPLDLDRWLWGRLQPFARDAPAPANLGKMVGIAETIAADIDYVRVDLYNLHGEIVFGELTAYPYSGFGTWVRKGALCNPWPPRDYDDELGDLWQLPESTASDLS